VMLPPGRAKLDTGEQARREFEAQSLRSLEVDDQLTGAAGPTPNPASTNHLAPQYTVSDAKVGNRQTLRALVRRRGNGEGDCGWPLPHARCGERIKF
jgi:hypothetical protein